jgi:hypothetical protein
MSQRKYSRWTALFGSRRPDPGADSSSHPQPHNQPEVEIRQPNTHVNSEGTSASIAAPTVPIHQENLAQGIASKGDPTSAPISSATSSNPPNVDHLGEKDNYGIKIVYNPVDAAVDIIFIHGLTGSAYSTWLHKESGVHWPRDLLKENMKHARIMTFGYDADVVNFWTHAAQDGISGYANDLLASIADRRDGIPVSTLIPESCSSPPIAAYIETDLTGDRP